MILNKSGKIVDILPMRSRSPNGYAISSQEYVLQDMFGDAIVFTVSHKKTIEAYDLKKGQEVAVLLELESYLYQNKVYHSLNCLQLYKLIPNPYVPINERKKVKKQKQPPKTGNKEIDEIPL